MYIYTYMVICRDAIILLRLDSMATLQHPGRVPVSIINTLERSARRERKVSVGEGIQERLRGILNSFKLRVNTNSGICCLQCTGRMYKRRRNATAVGIVMISPFHS